MLFPSVIFIFYFFPAVLILYYAFSFSRRIQNAILLIMSLIFYAYGQIKFLMIMLMSIVCNYLFGLMIARYKSAEKEAQAKAVLVLACVYNLEVLFAFKYINFFVRNLNAVTGYEITAPKTIIPLGISFFTFQALSYVIDVYDGEARVQKNLFYLGLYIAFFPQLIAGPIVRYNSIDDAIRNRKETWQKFSVGCCRFVTGLAKKVLIANSMAQVIDRIYSILYDNGSIPMSLAWLGSIAYTFQIFFDFSSYSDMAIGLGLIFGFKFEENFNYPYISLSMTEFWRRWHISLSKWFRNYVYFKLGGSRVKSTDKLVRNLLAVWLLTGIWHGAEWTYIIWGLFNFNLIIFEKNISFEQSRMPNILKHIYALFCINLAWVFFRAPTLVDAGNYIECMFGFKNQFTIYSQYTYMFFKEYASFFIAAVIFSMPVARKINKLIVDRGRFSRVFEYTYPVALICLLCISISYIVKGSYNPFIYFNF